ncbi:transporter substrate-binding domain-containing protein [Planococcus sp. N028]|uniref:Transporter substrate-binding domain-containing protein n=1 Tax=Planococcus shixiaomingii TaxID=3058393 RepID=A0ABT8N5R8_9BACL|nr:MULTISPECIES: transporter substrate-binding domain-containing protein [unclassified Planococcus (in: firmicutes)]MDN7243231.1 transporter substrate-binding domain-containing protein [Planococcus sp. N028]WKA55174.1 transporter substrate-binding domain-containing protein [Planococcus sp. N022]
MKKFSFFWLLLTLILFVVACGPESGQPQMQGGEDKASEGTRESGGSNGGGAYLVGIDTTYPPFEFQVGGEYTGIDIEIINAIAESQDFEIELRPMDFVGIIPALEAGELDLAIAGMSITDERKEILDFSEPYFDAGLTLVVNADNTEVTSLDDLDGKVVAVKNGTTGSKFARENQEQYGYRIADFEDSPSMFLEVANGHADVLLEDYPVIAYAITRRDLELKTVGERLTDDQYGIAVLKGKNSDLLEKINAGLKELRDSGKYDEILKKYIDDSGL